MISFKMLPDFYMHLNNLVLHTVWTHIIKGLLIFNLEM